MPPPTRAAAAMALYALLCAVVAALILASVIDFPAVFSGSARARPSRTPAALTDDARLASCRYWALVAVPSPRNLATLLHDRRTHAVDDPTDDYDAGDDPTLLAVVAREPHWCIAAAVRTLTAPSAIHTLTSLASSESPAFMSSTPSSTPPSTLSTPPTSTTPATPIVLVRTLAAAARLATRTTARAVLYLPDTSLRVRFFPIADTLARLHHAPTIPIRLACSAVLQSHRNPFLIPGAALWSLAALAVGADTNNVAMFDAAWTLLARNLSVFAACRSPAASPHRIPRRIPLPLNLSALPSASEPLTALATLVSACTTPLQRSHATSVLRLATELTAAPSPAQPPSPPPQLLRNGVPLVEGRCCEPGESQLVLPRRLAPPTDTHQCVYAVSSRFLWPYPGSPNWFPRVASPCLLDDWTLSARLPEYSILIGVHNRQATVHITLVQLLKLTAGPWELLILLDGCDDRSEQVVVDLLARYRRGWPLCPYTQADVNPSQVWVSGVPDAPPQPPLGDECLLLPLSLVRVRILMAPVPGVQQTAGSNLLMRMSTGRYWIAVDDYQIMTAPGWNHRLSLPMRIWPDLVGVSMRCGHDFPFFKAGPSVKCINTSEPLPTNDRAFRCSIFIRDTVNRGPWLLDAIKTHALGYLDEINYAGMITAGNDDHHFHVRARQRGWKPAYVPVDYTEERCCRTPALSVGDLADFQNWWYKRGVAANVSYTYGRSGAGNEERTIRSAAFHPLCT
jgi:hypothetical protein